MNFIKKHKAKLVTAFLLIAGFNALQCANQASRTDLLPDLHNEEGGGALGLNPKPQVTTLTKLINQKDAGKADIAKYIFVQEEMNALISNSLEVLQLDVSEQPWREAYNSLKELGLEPLDPDPNMNRRHVYSNTASNGIRYVNIGFQLSDEEDSIESQMLAFEVEPFDNNFEFAIDSLKSIFLGEEATPCHDTSQEQVYFRKGDWIVKVMSETKDSLDLGAGWPPRSEADIGSVKISLSKGGHYHALEDTNCFADQGHDHD